MNIANEEFEQEFTEFGLSLDSDEIIDKLRYLCQQFHLDASSISLEWVAFAHSKKTDCPLNLENLDLLERERLSRKGNKISKTPSSAKKHPKPKVYPHIIYDIDTLESVVGDEDGEELLGAYSTPSKNATKKRQLTPETSVSKRAVGMGRSPVVPFSPSSLSPTIATPSRKYELRNNSGEVVLTVGNIKGIIWKTSRVNQTPVICHHDQENHLTHKFKYMFQKLSDKAAVLNDLIDDMCKKLQDHHHLEEISNVTFPVQDTITVVGRIGCDSNGKLNAKSVVLEGSRDTSMGKNIALDLTEIKQFSLFPGQIVAMDGINSTGAKFVAKKIYENIPLALPEKKPNIPAEALCVVIACGPFSTSDNLMYEPFRDLIQYLQKTPPDVCILLGPFLDVKNTEIEKGNISVTYRDFFHRTIEQLATATHRLPTQLVIVPSQRDVHHHNVYPQPPFSLPSLASEKIHFVSDPCTLMIDDVVFGITSTDILFHLGAEEISHPPGSSDRLGRLTQHIITQHSYYPLYPANDEVNVDYDAFDLYAMLNVTPHVMVLPSDLRYFIKDICGSCCVNPGRLAKGQVGGTFARMHIMPPNGQSINKSLIQSISTEIVQI